MGKTVCASQSFRQRGFLVVEAAVALVIAGVIAAAVIALLVWSVTVQTRTSLAADYAGVLQQGADRLAGLIRQAGGAAKPAVGGGTASSLVLCGIQEGPRIWRGRVQAAEDGSLVITPLGGAIPSGCQGTDLPGNRVLVPRGYVAAIQFNYYSQGQVSPATGCGGRNEPACADVVAIALTITAKPPAGPQQTVLRIRPQPVMRFVTVRN